MGKLTQQPHSPLLPRAPWHGHPLCSPKPQCWQGGASLSPGRSPFEESAKMGSLSRGRSQSWGGHRFYAKACVNQGFVSPKFQSPPSQECLSMTAGQLSAPDTELCHCHPSEHPPNRSANPLLSKYIKIKGGRQRKGTGCAHKAFVNNNPVKGSSELHDAQCQPDWGSCTHPQLWAFLGPAKQLHSSLYLFPSPLFSSCPSPALLARATRDAND